MNTKLLLSLLGVAFLAVACVDTVGGRSTAGVPFMKDKVEGRYERPLNQVKVETRTVWIRVQPVEASVTAIQVQARTKAGGVDIGLAHELEKQVALRLVSR
jgi:hypothetical protein